MSLEGTARGGAPAKQLLALLLPAHNEELLLAATIRSAIGAGQSVGDIYVVDDNSSDATAKIALKILGPNNVLSVERSGKALAVKKAIAHFKIEQRYKWIHVADADSMFGKEYFYNYRANLTSDYVAAVGVVQSLEGNWLCKYRAYTYTYGQVFIRKLQSVIGAISVMPGPVTCYRTDILHKLDFETGSLTEDFDITLQIHRYKLGAIRFIPNAINYTQDPRTIRDFVKQTQRWYRGFFQGLVKYKIGRRAHRIDAYIAYILLETLVYFLQIFCIYPLILLTKSSDLARIFLLDLAVFYAFVTFSAVYLKRPSMVLYFPLFVLVKGLEVLLFIWSAVEILLLRKFTQKTVGWDTKGRRYALENSPGTV